MDNTFEQGNLNLKDLAIDAISTAMKEDENGALNWAGICDGLVSYTRAAGTLEGGEYVTLIDQLRTKHPGMMGGLELSPAVKQVQILAMLAEQGSMHDTPRTFIELVRYVRSSDIFGENEGQLNDEKMQDFMYQIMEARKRRLVEGGMDEVTAMVQTRPSYAMTPEELADYEERYGLNSSPAWRGAKEAMINNAPPFIGGRTTAYSRAVRIIETRAV